MSCFGRFAYVAFCLSAFAGIMWAFGTYVATPFGRWYVDTFDLWGLLGFPLLPLFWWWAMRRERRLIAEGKVALPRQHEPRQE